jgi:hypothetical protein
MHVRSSDAERVGIGVPLHTGGLSPILRDHVCRISPSAPPRLRSWKRRRDCFRDADAAYSFTRDWLGHRQLVGGLHHDAANSHTGA